METTKLYYEDAYLREFDAAVLSCREEQGRYLVVLDRTAFYPEGGRAARRPRRSWRRGGHGRAGAGWGRLPHLRRAAGGGQHRPRHPRLAAAF